MKKRTKYSKLPQTIICDTETYTDRQGSTDPSAWKVIPYGIAWFEIPHHWNFKKKIEITDDLINEIIEDVQISWDVSGWHKKFFEGYLMDLCLYKKPKIWFHNADYDIRAIFPFYLTHNIKGELKAWDDKANKFTWSVQDTGKLLWFKYARSSHTRSKTYRKLNFEVFCTFKFFRQALGDCVPKQWRHLKTSIDYAKFDEMSFDLRNSKLWYKNEAGERVNSSLLSEENYFIQDIVLGTIAYIQMNNYKLITKQILINIGSKPLTYELESLDRAATTASLSKMAVNIATKGNFNKYFRWIVKDSLEYAKQKACSCGGYTSFNKHISKFECVGKYADWEIVAYDVNSMYPYYMCQPLPVGPTSLDPNEFPPNERFAWYVCHMTRVTWKPEFEIMAQQIFSQDSVMNGTWNEHQFYLHPAYYELIKKYGDSDIELKYKVYQEFKPVLADFMGSLYEERKKYKKEDPANLIIKLIMNSLYGKACEKSYVTDYKYEIIMEDDKPLLHKSKKPNFNETQAVLTGVYIIQAARVELLQSLLDEVEVGNIVLYTDTDSLKIAKPKAALTQLELKGKVDPTTLGKWKKEGIYNIYLSPHKAKKYLLANTEDFAASLTVALSGINKEWQAILIKYCTLEDWKRIMDPSHMVVIVNGCKRGTYTYAFKQVVIRTSDFVFQGKRKNNTTFYLEFKGDKINWTTTHPNEVI